MTKTVIDLANDKPLYLQLAETIKQKISRNVWEIGMMIPSENELAREFDISVGTVKKALGVLVQEGTLFRRQGKGTFVSKPDFSKSFSRFFRYGQEGKVGDESPGSMIKAISVVTPPAQITAVLQLSEEAKVVHIKRVRTLQQIPFSVEELYLPYPRFKGIEDLELADQMLYPIYNEQFSTPVIWADDYLQPGVADAEAAAALGIEVGAPVMCVERLAHTYEDIPVEWRRSTGRGDSFRYHTVIR